MKKEEHTEQCIFLDWFKENHPGIFIYAIPNGGHQINRLNWYIKEGMVPGMPDLHIPEWNLWIEMKSFRGALKDNQKKVLERLAAINHNIIVAYGWQDAVLKITTFTTTPELRPFRGLEHPTIL